MIEFYPQIKLLHVVAVVCSGALFLLRGVAVQAHGRWAMTPPVRYLSYSIDTVLLAAALLLVFILPATVFANGWLHLKVLLLVFYIGLGTFALKRGRTPRIRASCFVVALLVYTAMFIIALTHDPRGLWTIL